MKKNKILELLDGREPSEQLKQLACAIAIMLTPFKIMLSIDNKDIIRNMRKRASCKAYWKSVDNIASLHSNLKRIYEDCFKDDRDGGNNFPNELNILFGQIKILPEKIDDVNEDTINAMIYLSWLIDPVLSKLCREFAWRNYDQDEIKTIKASLDALDKLKPNERLKQLAYATSIMLTPFKITPSEGNKDIIYLALCQACWNRLGGADFIYEKMKISCKENFQNAQGESSEFPDELKNMFEYLKKLPNKIGSAHVANIDEVKELCHFKEMTRLTKSLNPIFEELFNGYA
ncbi:MAG: hypothetical protein EHM85_02945 [Desulfobacteraceae bacterium]|nr:MAG: hypothetical protein EHM85_02945 [Desulfobacteraceae bacterium]